MPSAMFWAWQEAMQSWRGVSRRCRTFPQATERKLASYLYAKRLQARVLVSAHAASMEPRRNTVINALDQPRYGVMSCCKHHVVL